ncbi:MAG: hypothetical protein R2856_16440 [Caldilineaceae bacterium]
MNAPSHTPSARSTPRPRGDSRTQDPPGKPTATPGRWTLRLRHSVSDPRRLDVDTVRDQINQMGDCPLVIGTPDLIKVHVHALQPGPGAPTASHWA